MTDFITFDELLNKRPHDIRAVFVSDLHLSINTTQFNQAFIHLLNQLIALPNLTSLYILGDWLDGWLGDDEYFANPHHWLQPIIAQLKQLSHTCQIYVMHGNRDFAIEQKLCDTFCGKLINEPYHLALNQKNYRLEHGDLLCTDDVYYQRYRKIIRNPIIRWLLLKLPLSTRQKLASNIKSQSKNDKTQKSSTIMDVNATAVQQALLNHDVLIHGHTHRPALHSLDSKTRLVLGDWRDDGGAVQAVIGVYLLHSSTAGELVLSLYSH
ncbi:MAG: UDP-2,3-diacylglucosamine diphosphatase [Moraxella sp.]|nr:UDP-2,3-diacylglucosamine diphosphatase [Moraxella sp.]